MREIKFRCYDKNEEYMLPWEHLVEAGDLSEMLLHGHEEDSDYSKLMQFTGLKDKNGVEIYEGDVLDYTGSQKTVLRFEVVFHHASFKRKWLSEKTIKTRGIGVEHLAWNTGIIFEVLGNRYENPELLDTQK